MTDDARADLDDWLTDFDADEDPAMQPAALEPDTANRILRRLRAVKRRRADDAAVAKAEKDRIDGWLTARTDRYDTETARLEATLEDYMRARNAADPKAKTLALPNGTLKLRPTRNRVIMETPLEFLEWVLARISAEECVDVKAGLAALHKSPLIKVTAAPSLTGIAKAVEEGPATVDDAGVRAATPIIGTAEIVPGVSLQRLVADSFSLTIDDNPDATPPAYGDNEQDPDPRETR